MKETTFEGTIVARMPGGEEVLVEVFKTQVIGQNDMAVDDESERLGYLKLKNDGRHVKYVSKGIYQILGSPIIEITSNDPKAP